MPSNPLDGVVDKSRRCVDLRDQRGGLTASVIESLRGFLRHNDHYIHLCLSDNLLASEALAELCTLLKRHPYLTSLEIQHCGLQDKDFCFYFGPALISMPHLTFVDLSRNSGLTDSSAETVARILLETEVESVRLIGTSLTAAGGHVIAAAAANTTALVNCELPYTVGNTVLDAVEAHTRRNRAHRERLLDATAQYTRLRVSHCRLPSLPGLRRMDAAHALEAGAAALRERDSSSCSSSLAPTVVSGRAPAKSVSPRQAAQKPPPPLLTADAHGLSGASSEDRQWRACISKGRRRSWVRPEPPAVTVLLPSQDRQTPTPSSTSTPTTFSTPGTAAAVVPHGCASASPFPRSPPPPSVTPRSKATPDSLDAVTMWDWADPAMSNALRCLFVLDHQAQVLDQYRAAAAPPSVAASLAPVAAARRSKSRSKHANGCAVRRGSSSGRGAASISLPSLPGHRERSS